FAPRHHARRPVTEPQSRRPPPRCRRSAEPRCRPYAAPPYAEPPYAGLLRVGHDGRNPARAREALLPALSDAQTLAARVGAPARLNAEGPKYRLRVVAAAGADIQIHGRLAQV